MELKCYDKQAEEFVKEHWKKNNVIAKVRKKKSKPEKTFFFMDGPPYASGHIHMGTALNKILKDIAIRYWRMNNYLVFDRPGYDTHGMPIELQVEKLKNFKTKQDIEDFGVKNFVEECRSFATKYIGIMNEEFRDLGVWMDWDNEYKTLDSNYVEAIWWTFKKAYDKGIVYQGLYPSHVCPRCETVVAYNEIEYAKQTDKAIYLKFKLKEEKNTFLIIWTTTPWTLPGNTGIMVHPKFEYAKIQLSDGENWIMAKKRLPELMNSIETGYTIIKEFNGKELEGKEYENPLAKHLKLEKMSNAYKVIASERYVNLEEGTGLVHCAPGHGKEDFDAGKKAGLPAISPVGINGLMTKEAGKYSGKKARIVDEEIINDLEKEKALAHKHSYSHDYPVCWRCKSPLLMISIQQWFISVKTIQEKAIEENETVKWIPEWMKDRMKNWLETLSDWPVTRARYWGAPCPIWVCDKCKEKKVIGSIEELKKLADLPKDFEPHKPGIDKIEFPCKCNGMMKIIPEILDVWFDAGVSSWAALGFPQKKELFEKFWPADLNIEATEQVRGWWNAQLLCSLICFDKKPFKSILTHGMVLDLGKKKMSKSIGNIVSPKEVIEKYNTDYLRHYLANCSGGQDVVFNWENFKEIHRIINTFWNCINFAVTYIGIDFEEKIIEKELLVEDKWLLSKLNKLVEETKKAYENYCYDEIISKTNNFILEEFSRTYIKLIRDRIGTSTEKEVKTTISIATRTLLGILAPIMPHLTEYVYLNTKGKKEAESIHLTEYPKTTNFAGKEKQKQLIEGMETTKEAINTILSMREEKNIKLRWVLKEACIETQKQKELEEFSEIIKTAANIQKVEFKKPKNEKNFAMRESNGTTIWLNTEKDKELEEEWELRELIRRIQEKRKEKELEPKQTIELQINCNDKAFLKKYWKKIEEKTNTKLAEKEGKTEKILNKEFYINIAK